MMRRVRLGSTGIETSCLGFGCASLGSRVAAEPGLAALAEAVERGVSWIDLAPIYGAGRAEEIVAPFLRGRRDRLQICTKVGLALPTAAAGGLRGAVLPLARRLVAAVPGLRGALRRGGVGAANPLPLTADLVRSSLDASLRRLGTDYVDLYALHDPDPEAALREPVLRALEDILAAGKARAVAVAGDLPAAARSVAHGPPFGVVQLPLPAPGAETDLLAQAEAAGMGVIAHSVFGIEGALARLGRRLGEDPAARAEALAATGAPDGQAAIARLLLGRAFALNPHGVVLASMFSPRSRSQNIAVAAEPPGAEAAGLIARIAA